MDAAWRWAVGQAIGVARSAGRATASPCCWPRGPACLAVLVCSRRDQRGARGGRARSRAGSQSPAQHSSAWAVPTGPLSSSAPRSFEHRAEKVRERWGTRLRPGWETPPRNRTELPFCVCWRILGGVGAARPGWRPAALAHLPGKGS